MALKGYELSRNWFDFCFENPEKIKPNHTALYFFMIEHCNRLGWKEKFGLPTTMSMEAIGIKSYNTYINTFNELAEFGVIKIIEKSKNQYSANIIALSNFNKAPNKALDKALIKHGTKHCSITSESISSINKQRTKNKEQLTINKYEFDKIWNLYEKKGNRKTSEQRWDKISDKNKALCLIHIPKYVNSTPDKQYRKNFEVYINKECWNDEIITKNKTISNDKTLVETMVDFQTKLGEVGNA